MSAAANMIYVLLLQIITTIIINPFSFILFNSSAFRWTHYFLFDFSTEKFDSFFTLLISVEDGCGHLLIWLNTNSEMQSLQAQTSIDWIVLTICYWLRSSGPNTRDCKMITTVLKSRND